MPTSKRTNPSPIEIIEENKKTMAKIDVINNNKPEGPTASSVNAVKVENVGGTKKTSTKASQTPSAPQTARDPKTECVSEILYDPKAQGDMPAKRVDQGLSDPKTPNVSSTPVVAQNGQTKIDLDITSIGFDSNGIPYAPKSQRALKTTLAPKASREKETEQILGVSITRYDPAISDVPHIDDDPQTQYDPHAQKALQVPRASTNLPDPPAPRANSASRGNPAPRGQPAIRGRPSLRGKPAPRGPQAPGYLNNLSIEHTTSAPDLRRAPQHPHAIHNKHAPKNSLAPLKSRDPQNPRGYLNPDAQQTSRASQNACATQAPRAPYDPRTHQTKQLLPSGNPGPAVPPTSQSDLDENRFGNIKLPVVDPNVTNELLSRCNMNEKVLSILRPQAQKIFNPRQTTSNINVLERLSEDENQPQGYNLEAIISSFGATFSNLDINSNIFNANPGCMNASIQRGSKTERAVKKTCHNLFNAVHDQFLESGAATARCDYGQLRESLSSSTLSPITSRSELFMNNVGTSRHNLRFGTPRSSSCSLQYAAPVSPSVPSPPHYAVSRLGVVRSRDSITSIPYSSSRDEILGPMVMANGTIQLRLRNNVRVDMTVDAGIRVFNQRSMIAIAVSGDYENAALIHPNGRVLQFGSKVEIVTYDGIKNGFVRYAKMWYKGISFTSDKCALVYLVDSAGTRTTNDTFSDLSGDFTITVLHEGMRTGIAVVKEATDIVSATTFLRGQDGSEIYDINGFRIAQGNDGLIKITRVVDGVNRLLIRTSPSNGSATLTTSLFHATASLGKNSHLFVRRSEKRIHFDGSNFIVRNAGHSAGFNESNLLIVY